MAKVDYNYPIEALHGKVKKTHRHWCEIHPNLHSYLNCPQRGAKRSATEVCGSGESRKGAYGGRFQTSRRLDRF